jgi:NADPH-dependent curcumin reductase CurA
MAAEAVPDSYRLWTYAQPIAGGFGPDNLAMQVLPLPALEEGEALVRVKLLNLHPGARFRMQVGLVPLGTTDPSNFAYGEVIASRNPVFAVGDMVACQSGWQDYAIIRSDQESVGYGPASEAVCALNRTRSQWTYVMRPELVSAHPPDALKEVFGTSGMTAWFGLRECGPMGPGVNVAVAGMTGSVGHLAAQIAKAAGCNVVGFGGGPARCKQISDLIGVDCLDYRAPDFLDRLRATFPEGIDIISDGIGGPLTEAIVPMMKRGGRLLAYGCADDLHAGGNPGARGMTLREQFGVSAKVEAIVAERAIRVECWIVHDFYHERIEAEDALDRLLRDGAIKPVVTVVEGFDKLPQAIMALYDPAALSKVQAWF